MLKFFDNICKKYDLTYYLTCGSCLGAVRHGGFIPWDDDLDVAMPRESYEKLWSIYNNNYSGNRYVLCRTTKDQCIRFHIMQLRDSETTFIYEHSIDLDICHGIKIDICPIDGCPDSVFKRFGQSMYAQLFGLFAAQRIPNQASKAKQLLAKIILNMIPSKTLRTKIWQFAEKQVSKYPIENCSSVRCLEGKPYEKRIFGEPQYLPFEGELRPVPSCFDEYLKIGYGDYMIFPPEEKRRPESVVSCFDLNRSYRDYKGVEYLITDHD